LSNSFDLSKHYAYNIYRLNYCDCLLINHKFTPLSNLNMVKKVALITGGASGMGLAVAEALAARTNEE
jgi:hypothetical protein